MSVRLPRWVWTVMLSAMLLAFSGIAAFTQIAPLTISASPTSFNPSTGQTATVIYNNSIKVYTMRVDVKNGSGSVVRNLASYDMIGTGPWNRVWDGKSSTGANVPAGSYSVVFTGKDSSGRTLAPATTTVTVTGTIAPPPPTTFAFRINSITPSTVDPRLGQTTTVTYTVPTTCDLRVFVKNSVGTEVRTLTQVSGVPAGTRTVSWDAKSSIGSVVPNGTYTVTVESLSMTPIITPANGAVTVAASTITPPVTGSLTISANPTLFDPTQGQTASVTYNNNVKVYTMRVDVKNSGGTVVRNIASYNLIGLGPWTKTWDGKNSMRTIVPAGTYSIVYSGNDSTGRVLTAATATITVATGTVTPPPPTTYAFNISGITPSTIDMTLGQSTTVTYTVPTTTDVRVSVKNSAGTEVRTLATVTGAAAGTRTATWDGRNSAGSIVANGTYTVTVESLSATPAITPASGTVTVTTSTVTPPPPPPTPSDGLEKGQIIEGAGSSNWDWTKRPGYKMGISLKAPKTGTLTQVTLQWKKSTGYGAGNYGKYNFELHTNGAGNFPSGNIIASASNVNPNTAMDNIIDGAFHVALNAQLTAGQIYHIVIYNVDPSPSSNFSSPNGLMTRVLPWDGTGNRTCYYSSGSWKPYGSTSSPWNTSGSNNVNAQYTATMLTWSDGTNTGAPYYSASLSGSARIYGSSRAGEYILWDKPTTTISRIGVSVKKNGTPGALVYHLDKVSGGSLATGTMNTSSMSGSYQNWVYATLPSAVTLTQGQAYRLWFESPSSSSSSNSYSSNAIYGEARPATWSALSFGGTRSYYIYGSSLSSTMPQADLSFSLQ